MRDFARRSSNDRSALFRVASQAKGINEAIIDWRLLGYKGNEPWESRSNSAQDRFVQEANQRAAGFIQDTFVPGVQDLFSRFLGEPAELAKPKLWKRSIYSKRS